MLGRLAAAAARAAVRDDRPITGQGEARRGDGREELLLRRGPLALLHTIHVQRDVHGARDRRRRAALAGLYFRGVAHIYHERVLEVREDLGIRDGPGPSAHAHEIGRKSDREQAARAPRLYS